jgi:hypothetical protein
VTSIGKLAWVALTPIAVLVAGIGGCEARKAYYDSQVREMCRKDGGMTVFERVSVDRTDYARLGGSHGQIAVPEERSASPDYPYVSNTTREIIKEDSFIRIIRTEGVIKRRVDGKVLARYVTYSRVGGDFPIGAHPSYSLCELVNGSASRKVFIVQEN